ncbi:MAG: DUF2568 domain-containing protein [Acidimicrobiia bacterium]|nr:DUF2568 domain-containing protein [Acidimicrobiia bacterium]
MGRSSDGSTAAGLSPFDTPASSTLRFLIELTAWVAGPWAAADLFDSGWAVVPALVLLMVLPSIFNVPGDKNIEGVPVSGTVRIAIEAFLLLVAVVASWLVWPPWAAVLVSIAAVGMVATGLPRYRWLAAGAPPTT